MGTMVRFTPLCPFSYLRRKGQICFAYGQSLYHNLHLLQPLYHVHRPFVNFGI